MFSDYRSFGQCQKNAFSGGTFSASSPLQSTASDGTPSGTATSQPSGAYMHVVALGTDTALQLTNCVFQTGSTHAGQNADTTINLLPGGQVPGLISFTIAAGQALVLWFKS